MARSSKKRLRTMKPLAVDPSPSLDLPAPHYEDLDEFPSLEDALTGKGKLSPAPCLSPSLSRSTENEISVEEGVCVDGTTYYMQAAQALCGIPEAIPSIALSPSYTQNETAHRQFPGKANALYEESLEYPTLFLPKNLRQAVYDQLDEYRSYLFFPDQPNWTVCDNFQIYGSMEKQSGLIQGKKNLVYISRQRTSGDFIVLRRLMNLVLRNQGAVNISSKWQTINHQNVVRIRSVTTTRAFNDPSVLFAYDFYPNAVTLETFVKNENRLLDEKTIWSVATQIASGLHAIHGEGLAARVLGEKRILFTGLDSCTVKINCVAMSEIIDIADVPHSTFTKSFPGEHRAKLEDQLADFRDLGSLVQYMIENCSGDISKDLIRFGKALADGTIHTMDMVLGSLGTRVFEYMALCQKQKGILETEISKEIENGRLFRLLYGVFEKIGKYDEHLPGTENSQLLKMFESYLLRRSNMFEVISSLNKLDAGVREKVRLESYAESIVKYVSYEELRRVLEEDQSMMSTFFYHLNVFNDSGLMG